MNARAHIDQISRGFQHATVLLAAAKLGVFDALVPDGAGAEEAAHALGCDVRAVETLLYALTAEGFVRVAGQRFFIVDDYAPFLLSDGAESMASILSHHYNVLARWAQLAEVVRTGKSASETQQPREDGSLRDFICGMADISRKSSVEVAEKLDLSPFRNMLDLGGGPGTSSIVFCRKYPELHSLVFDRPPVIPIAREEIAKADLGERIETRGGDMLSDDFGRGFDLVYVSNIIHMLGPDEVAKVFAKAAHCLEPGGTIVVKDFFLEESRIEPPAAALFSINMLVGTREGRSYTYDETEDLLGAAGFWRIRHRAGGEP